MTSNDGEHACILYHSFFSFKGSAWISSIINMRGGDWMLRTTASLVKRNDTGKINSSPKSVMQPIVRLQLGCNHTITIPGITFRVNKGYTKVITCLWTLPYICICNLPDNCYR